MSLGIDVPFPVVICYLSVNNQVSLMLEYMTLIPLPILV